MLPYALNSDDNIFLGFAPPPFDAFAASAYLIIVILEVLILILTAILNPIAYYRRRRAKTNDSIKENNTVNTIASARETIVHLESARNKPTDPPDELAQRF